MIALALLFAAGSGTLPAPGERFIRQRFHLKSYRTATADLNGDGRREILVYSTGPDDCGSGGCVLYVLSPTAKTYRIVMRSTVTQLPIRLLPTRSHGWRDIGVTVSGGGIRKSYTARMRFDGRSYPSNPTVPPAIPLQHPRGELLISN
jgi:hypothetical protein